MTRSSILQEGASYTFRSYFELPNDTDEILAEFGYQFERQRLQLPATTREIGFLLEFQQQLEETIPYVSLSSEAVKREVFIEPVLTRVSAIRINNLGWGGWQVLNHAAFVFSQVAVCSVARALDKVRSLKLESGWQFGVKLFEV